MSEHYFTADPTSPEQRHQVEVTVWGARLRLQTASGVFAAGRLDRGTAILFRTAAPADGARRLLDLGCGYGVIACALAGRLPDAELWAVDVNARARELATENLALLGVSERAHVCAPDEVSDDVRFDEIWSNPPIHIGKAALHALLLHWLSRLVPTGRAVLVVGKNLGADSLQRWLESSGYRCLRLGSAKGFRVLAVHPGQ